MKLQPSTSFEQSKGTRRPSSRADCASLKALAMDSVAGKETIKNRVFATVGVLLIMLSALSQPASAQISYATTTPLYRHGTQLNPNLGICIHICSADNFTEAAADGFTWVRVDMSWNRIETTEGRYEWGLVDNICSLCKKYHLKPDWVVDYGNALYGSACSPDGITAFVNFAKAGTAESVAQGISGARYEIWNEPENFGWLGTLYNQPNANILTSAQVAQINNAAVGAIHAVDPTALVCTSAFGSLQAEVYWGVQAFAQGLGSSGAFDAVALHAYNLGKAYKSSEGNSDPNGDRNDNPECLMAYNASNVSTDLCPQVTLSVIPKYVRGTKAYWVTEVGRRLDNDCANNQDAYSYQWVRTALCHWMAGFQWQAHYVLDSDGTYVLQKTKAERAMKYLTKMTNTRSIARMSFPRFSGTLPPNNTIWSVTLSGSPAVQVVWVPEGSARVPVPAGWTATDMYGTSLNSRITNNALPMHESNGVYYLKMRP